MKIDIEEIINKMDEVDNNKFLNKFYKFGYVQPKTENNEAQNYFDCKMCNSSIVQEHRYFHLSKHHSRFIPCGEDRTYFLFIGEVILKKLNNNYKLKDGI